MARAHPSQVAAHQIAAAARLRGTVRGMDAARKRGDELVAEARDDARLLKYLAEEVVGTASAKNPRLDAEVTQRALMAGYRQLLSHAHNLEHVLSLYDEKLDG